MNAQHSHAAFSPGGRLGRTGSRDLYVGDTQLCDAQNTGSLRRASLLALRGLRGQQLALRCRRYYIQIIDQAITQGLVGVHITGGRREGGRGERGAGEWVEAQRASMLPYATVMLIKGSLSARNGRDQNRGSLRAHEALRFGNQIGRKWNKCVVTRSHGKHV